MTEEFKGFTLVEKKNLPDIHSESYLYRHIKTGAQIMYLKNDDDNKAFTIAFRTPPYDDNGIAHIIEHSVLNGSKKYSSKEPFVELLKGSLHTFLNAMTYPDKTIYPVASRNQKDFENLMGVYLDAVFYPNLLQDEQILMQEGWHYHLEQPEDELIYKGVVYNEMRGAFSQPESELSRLVTPTLFPDTLYRHESGGIPSAIPTLTQEKFVAFHQQYYHPSNARVVLYGNLDLAVAFKQLAEYFDAFEYRDIAFEQYDQPPFSKMKEIEKNYPIAPGATTQDKTLMLYAWAAGRSTNGEERFALKILNELLLGSNTAPLKKALLKANIASEVLADYSDHIYLPVFEIMLRDTNPEQKATFISIIQTELSRLVKEGIPKKLIQAAFNKIAFYYREFTSLEGSTPKGVWYAISSLTSWLYDGSPYLTFEYQRYLDKIHSQVDEGYFEKLIQRYLLDNPHAAVITLIPEVGLGEKREKALTEELAAYKQSLSSQEIMHLVEQTQRLIERQEKPSTKEDLAKIPSLSISDLQKEAAIYPLTVQKEPDSLTFLHYEDFTSGISYVNYYFDMRGIQTELIPVVGFLTEVLGKVATHRYSDEALTTELAFYTGGISTKSVVESKSIVDNEYYPFFKLSGKALSEYLPKLIELMEEILLHSNLEQYDKLKELLVMTKANLEMNFDYASHATAVRRLQSYYSQASKYAQAVEGIDYYDYIAELIEQFETRKELFVQQLKQVLNKLVTVKGMTATFVGSKEDFEVFKTATRSFIAKLPDHNVEAVPFTTPVEILNEGFKTAQEVQYVAKGYNQCLLGYPFNGMNAFLNSILSLDYLWNTVRVQGGAYGGMSFFTETGNAAFVSYRDPNLVETLATYDGAVDYLANYAPTDEEFEKNLIGTFSSIDMPLSALQKGLIAFARYFTHETDEHVQQIRDEILATTPQKVRSYATIMKEIMAQEAFVVIGQDSQIEKHRAIFKNIRPLFHQKK